MSIRELQQDFENEKKLLYKQFVKTQNNWNDPVQRRFYGEYIREFDKIIPSFISSISELDKIISKAKSAIENL